jgi:hypothetical protein
MAIMREGVRGRRSEFRGRSKEAAHLAAGLAPRASIVGAKRDKCALGRFTYQKTLYVPERRTSACLPPHRLRIDHQLDPSIAGTPCIGGIGDDRMAAAVADDEQLPVRHSARPGQQVVDRHGLGDR